MSMSEDIFKHLGCISESGPCLLAARTGRTGHNEDISDGKLLLPLLSTP